MPGLRLAGTGSSTHTLRFGPTWARLGPWRGGGPVAHLVCAPDSPLDATAVQGCVDRARADGYTELLTNAIGPAEQVAFLDDGFTVREELHLLEHLMRAEPPVPHLAITRATRRDRSAVLALDDAAFAPFWRLGATGLHDALTATPARQFRAVRSGRDVTGYAITGLAGLHGYLQRIAVHPDRRRQGIGRALVDDALHWLWRHGVVRTLVNTQLDNRAALELYVSSGFEAVPGGLAVLGRQL